MKKIIYIITILFTFMVSNVSADSYNEILTDDMKNSIENSFQYLSNETGVSIDALEIIDKINNNGGFDEGFSGFFRKIKNAFSQALRDNLKSFTGILCIVLLTSVISKLNIGLKEQNITKMITASVVMLAVLELFLGISDSVIGLIDTLTVFINSLMPVLLTLLATGGKLITAKLLNPVIISASSVATLIIKSLIIPLSTISLSLKLTYSATQKENVLSISKHINSLIKWIIGFVLTIYMGLISLGTTVAINIDETTLKTAKFAVGSFIPYVGSMLSDSVELVLNSTLIVKNSLGIAGLIGVVAVVFVPCVSLIVKVLLFKLMCVLALPISEKNVVVALEGVSDCASVMLGMVLVVAVMYILSITVIINAGGA